MPSLLPNVEKKNKCTKSATKGEQPWKTSPAHRPHEPNGPNPIRPTHPTSRLELTNINLRSHEPVPSRDEITSSSPTSSKPSPPARQRVERDRFGVGRRPRQAGFESTV
ncbi:uncharacterized protein N7500_010787 [Penicillium coprophilum]|uniref:uncharacterized protein n=1 Tax=Penicillium coprophilum TaxID=36646 RepID=UPI002389961E|nr:uncharacterized protein N7500_010787 [Penicillium coprophilum]KAJ5150598.1 hypothetical protein N7500_010787 [Penicillium coprophilum]